MEIKVYNINRGHNKDKLERCGVLKDYSYFVDRVREAEAETPDKREAMERAVRYCIAHNILKTFLEANSSEVINMLLTEWNLEDALEVRWEEGWEKGVEELAGLLKGGKSLDEAMAIIFRPGQEEAARSQ